MITTPKRPYSPQLIGPGGPPTGGIRLPVPVVLYGGNMALSDTSILQQPTPAPIVLGGPRAPTRPLPYPPVMNSHPALEDVSLLQHPVPTPIVAPRKASPPTYNLGMKVKVVPVYDAGFTIALATLPVVCRAPIVGIVTGNHFLPEQLAFRSMIGMY